MPSAKSSAKSAAMPDAKGAPKSASAGAPKAAASVTDSLKPGQNVACAVARLPRSTDDLDTIARLMRRDPANKKALRRAQKLRRQRLDVHNRGNRMWTSREKAARVVRVAPGESWTMAYTPDIAPDIRAVEAFLTITPA